MTKHAVVFLCAIGTCFVGCSEPVANVPVVAESLSELPLVPHPEYANWSQFPVGTKVVRKDELASADGGDFLHTTIRLVAKSDKSITLETQTAIERSGKRADSDVNTFDYPAEFRLPKGMQLEQFMAPTPNAEKVGSETMEVAGKSYDVDVFTFEDQSEAGPVDVRTWRSLAIPGVQAKKQIVDKKGVVLSASDTVEIVMLGN